MNNMSNISFVIPCYNSSNTILSVFQDIELIMSTHKSYDYEIVAINDCSTDNVSEILNSYAAKNKKCRVIELRKNAGQHAALLVGMRHVNGDIIVCLDDDGQTPALECFKLIKGINDNIDVVYAKYEEKHHNWFRNFGSKINDIMATSLIGKPKNLYISSYFACKKEIVEEIVKYQNPFPYIEGLVLRTTNHIDNVVVEHKDRLFGSSNYSISKLLGLWLNGFTAFSVKPLRIASFVGAISSLIGFTYAIVIILKKLIYSSAPIGYSSLMASILFVGGIIMMLLGLIGEYIGRIYICINNTPQAIIKSTINVTDSFNNR